LSVTEKIILGIDPGSVVMGYGVIGISGQKIRIVEMGVLKLGKYPDTADRLNRIFNRVHELCVQHKPESCAIEAPFFGKNVQSMLKLGRAQGVAMAATMQSNIPMQEYSPKKVKQSVTGNGNATKEQLWATIQKILKFDETPQYLDASDAVGVALCHHFQSKFPISNLKSGKGWDKFIKENPDRVKQKK
jgi:crossover junction endodeoxyribonuclease RuvC